MERNTLATTGYAYKWRIMLLCLLGAMLFCLGSSKLSAKYVSIVFDISLVPKKNVFEQFHTVENKGSMVLLPEASIFSTNNLTLKTIFLEIKDFSPCALTQIEHGEVSSKKLSSQRIPFPRLLCSEKKKSLYPDIFLHYSFAVLPERILPSTENIEPLSCSKLPAYRGLVSFSRPPPLIHHSYC